MKTETLSAFYMPLNTLQIRLELSDNFFLLPNTSLFLNSAKLPKSSGRAGAVTGNDCNSDQGAKPITRTAKPNPKQLYHMAIIKSCLDAAEM